MLEVPDIRDGQPDAIETAETIYSKISYELEAAGVREDVAEILREAIFSDDEDCASVPAVMERLLELAEAAP